MNAGRLLRPTVRLRLTLLYGGLFLMTGAVLLAVNYLLVRRSITVRPEVLQQRIELRLGRSLFSFPAPLLSRGNEDLRRLLQQTARELRDTALHSLVVQSATAFGALALVSVGLGWLVAGRALRPLKQITGTARRLSGATLHQRIDLQGPDDELKELADTFDQMLERLDAAFASQRRFVANASHELRTPLSIIRTEIDVTLSNPVPNLTEFESMGQAVRLATERSERLIDSLLTLARSEGATPHGDTVDLERIAEEVAAGLQPEVSARSLRVSLSLAPATVRGDGVLIERLIQNLLTNAIRHNRPGGWVEVHTDAVDGRARVAVRNGGEPIAAGEVESLFEPFRRLGDDRAGAGRGFGLGLAIVRAVATAHGGTVSATPLPDGGLEVAVDLPAAPAGVLVSPRS